VDAHAPAVYRVARSIVRDPGLAEDVVQETMIRAWRSRDQLRDPGRERVWILRIAHNTAVSSLRRIRDHATDPALIPDRPVHLDPGEQIAARDDLARMAEILGGLDELSRSILVLRDLETLSYEEIADTLEVPLSTVKTRLLRARRELQRVARAEGRV
jgi:RNA polymerase sigma-70 factor (ECF subfamily)